MTVSLTGCEAVNPAPKELCGTQITDPTESLAGCLVNEKDEPAIGADVQLIPVAITAAKQSSEIGSHMHTQNFGDNKYIVQTNNVGRYSFKNPPSGNYELFFSTRDRAAIRTRVFVDSNHFIFEKDVIKPWGYLEGKVYDMQTKSPIKQAECSVVGRPFTSISDDSGNFTLILPSGDHNLTCIVSPYRSITVRDVKIVSGQPSKLNMGMENGDPFSEVQSPASLSTIYDPVTGIVHLTWPKVTSLGFVQYALIRKDKNQGSQDTTIEVSDTTYDDLIFSNRTDPEYKYIYYSVCSITSKQTFTSPVQAPKHHEAFVRPAKVGPDIDLKVISRDTSLPLQDSGFSVGDTLKANATFINFLRINTSLVWILKKSMADTSFQSRESLFVEEQRETKSIRILSGSSSFAYPCLKSGHYELQLTIVDERGASNSAAHFFRIRAKGF